VSPGLDPAVSPGLDPAARPGFDQAASPVLDPAVSPRLDPAASPVLDPPPSPPSPPSPGLGPAGRAAPHPAADPARAGRWLAALARGRLGGAELMDLLRDYGIPAARTQAAASCADALAAAARLGYPVVLKTDEPGVAHKSDVGGVLLGLAGPAALADGYRDLAARLGPRVVVCETVAPGTELILGIARDPALGPLIVAGAGGVLAELLADRTVALPPVDQAGARRMLARLRASALLDGMRGQPPADTGSIAAVITGLSALAAELGDALTALDINPLICGPSGAMAVDVLVVPRDAG
jgi:hypothetical protein